VDEQLNTHNCNKCTKSFSTNRYGHFGQGEIL